MLLILIAATCVAFASPPSDLDQLLEIAAQREPELAALAADADSARSRSVAARRWVDPEIMVGVQSLGSTEKVEPTMGMIGASQMLRGWGEGRIRSERLELDAERAGIDQDRVRADLRQRLWATSARIGALQEELQLLDEQLRSAAALRDIAFARYSAGADVSGGMTGMGGMAPGSMGDEMDGMGVEPPIVTGRSGGGAGGGGMAGMDGGEGRGGSGPTVPSPAPVPPATGSISAGAEAGGMPVLLRLDAEIARVAADRAALERQLAGEVRVLAQFVGDEGASAVQASPTSFFGDSRVSVPEVGLAELDVAAASTDLELARALRRPDFMVNVTETVMPDGMPMGTDVSVGVEVPLWGGKGREIDAARADVAAAAARQDRVLRDLAVAVEQGRAALDAAEARSEALDTVALPRARAAWDATLALFAAGAANEDDVVRAWETWLDVGREAVAARLDVQRRAAELARVEGT